MKDTNALLALVALGVILVGGWLYFSWSDRKHKDKQKADSSYLKNAYGGVDTSASTEERKKKENNESSVDGKFHVELKNNEIDNSSETFKKLDTEMKEINNACQQEKKEKGCDKGSC